MMSGCRAHREAMSALLDGAATPEERKALDLHLAECADCRKALEELRWTTAQLRRLEPVEPPPWMTARIMARVRADDAPSRSVWRRLVFPVLASAQFRVASLVLVAAAGYYIVSRSPGMLKEASEAPARQEGGAGPAPAAPEAKRDFAPPPPAGSMAADGKGRGDRPAPRVAAPPPGPRVGREAPREAEREPAVASPPTGRPADRAPRSAGPEGPPPAAAAPALEAAPEVLGAADSGQAAPEAAAGGVSGALSVSKSVAAAPPPHAARQAPAPSAAAEPRQRDLAKKEKGAATAPGLLVVTFVPFDPPGFRALAERELERAGAVTVPEAGGPAANRLSARVESGRLAELLDRLSRAGTIRERPELAGPLPRVVTVTILW